MKCELCQTEFDPAADSSAGQDSFCPRCRKNVDTIAVESAPMLNIPTATGGQVDADPEKGIRGRIVWRSSGSDQIQLMMPISTALHPSGDIIVLDEPEDYRVLRFDSSGKFLEIVLEVPIGDGDGEVDDPQGICVDTEGSFYITDAGNDRISLWNADGSFSHCLGGPGTQTGMLAHPFDVDVDEELWVYVADSFNHRIQKMSRDGLVSLEVRELGAWGQFQNPVAISTDIQKNIYVGDDSRNQLIKLSSDGEPLMLLPGADDPQDLFDGPGDVRLAPDGSFYVSDRRNLRVQRFAPGGKVTGVVDMSHDQGEAFSGGDIAIMGEYVVLPDRANEVLLCLEFEDV